MKMLWQFILLTLLECAEITLCSNSDNELKDELISESELFELMEDQFEWRSANGTNSTETSSVLDLLTDPAVATVALVGAPAILAAIVPQPPPMFPPQGAPQPGSVTAGGGVALATSLIVIKNMNSRVFIVIS